MRLNVVVGGYTVNGVPHWYWVGHWVVGFFFWASCSYIIYFFCSNSWDDTLIVGGTYLLNRLCETCPSQHSMCELNWNAWYGWWQSKLKQAFWKTHGETSAVEKTVNIYLKHNVYLASHFYVTINLKLGLKNLSGILS